MFWGLKANLIYSWYRNFSSGFTEQKENGTWGKDDIITENGNRKSVPILKQENMGENMAIDEKMINQEMYTVLTNSDTGKIAMLAETMESKELEVLLKKLNAASIIKNITGDLSPMYESLCKKALPDAKMIADKFHVVSHSLDMLQDIRIRHKHEEIAKMPKKKKERELYEQSIMV